MVPPPHLPPDAPPLLRLRLAGDELSATGEEGEEVPGHHRQGQQHRGGHQLRVQDVGGGEGRGEEAGGAGVEEEGCHGEAGQGEGGGVHTEAQAGPHRRHPAAFLPVWNRRFFLFFLQCFCSSVFAKLLLS